MAVYIHTCLGLQYGLDLINTNLASFNLHCDMYVYVFV